MIAGSRLASWWIFIEFFLRNGLDLAKAVVNPGESVVNSGMAVVNGREAVVNSPKSVVTDFGWLTSMFPAEFIDEIA